MSRHAKHVHHDTKAEQHDHRHASFTNGVFLEAVMTQLRHLPPLYASLSLGYKNNRFSSNNEHGTVRVLHHPRRNAPDEKPGDAAQPLGPHHDQIGLVFGGRLHDLFSRLPTFEPRG